MKRFLTVQSLEVPCSATEVFINPGQVCSVIAVQHYGSFWSGKGAFSFTRVGMSSGDWWPIDCEYEVVARELGYAPEP